MLNAKVASGCVYPEWLRQTCLFLLNWGLENKIDVAVWCLSSFHFYDSLWLPVVHSVY
jgi:hypothetical protein